MGETMTGDGAAGRWPVTIAQVSDLHIGAHLPAVVDSLIADVTAAAPSLTVVTGDLTMRARRAEFLTVRAALVRLPRPLLVVLGNHDVPLDRPSRIWAPYARYQRQIAPDLNPMLELPGLRALGLQSMPRWRWKGGRVSRGQASMVAELLGVGGPSSPSVRLIALHHPVSPAGPARIVGRDRLLRACRDAQIDVVLAGHTHRSAVHRLELTAAGRSWPVLEVVAGTATSTRDRGNGRSWNLIQIDVDSIRVQERQQVGSGWRTGRVVVHPRGIR
jgi:3',5'-cyclic AMP phosphodiesterase CpdA